MDYAIACAQATTSQGLDPVVQTLTEREITHGIAQTGGFCMVVTVPHDSGIWGVINEGEHYLAAWYSGDAWENSGEEGASLFAMTLNDLADIVSKPWEAN